jgi:hypothetical protein
MRRSAVRAMLGLTALVLAGGFQRPSPAPTHGAFQDWAAVVVAADWRAATGEPTSAFENARRDIAQALLSAGFRPDNLRTFGVDAQGPGVLETTPENLAAGLTQVADRAKGGCFVYFTSHGSPGGITFGRQAQGQLTMRPAALTALLDGACGDRPSVVMISACFSGVYIPAVAAPNRMVFTAARPDRTSFGCGVDDRYPFFDACVLETWPRAGDFAALGRAVQACVARKEQALGLKPPSEPQLRVGARIRPLLPLLPLPGAR